MITLLERVKVGFKGKLQWSKFLAAVGILCAFAAIPAKGQGTQPLVAIHDSEYTRALENQNASGATPTGSGTTGKQWWPTDWHYFVMPEAMKESLRSDGTAFAVVGDSNIISGDLLTNGQPKYPIVVSLAAEAIHDSQIAAFTNYVAAGGFLFVGSSSFTRNTNGTTRGNFALADQMGISMVVPGLTNWAQNSTYTKILEHRIHSHVPGGTLTWRLPSSSEEIPYGVATDPSQPHNNGQAQAPHDLWQVTNITATVLAQAGATPFLTIRQYGKGYFIYYAPMQPLLGNGGWAPTMYSYLTIRRAIEWAFEQSVMPVAKISPWPFQYDAAYMVRHDLESFSNAIAGIEASAQLEFNNGASGDYYFCTGTLRENMSANYDTNAVVASLRRAMTNYGAIIGPHNGGLTNPMIAGTPFSYDYWHWGPDEVLNITPPPGYSSGSNYAYTSMSRSFQDIESWLPGLMTNGMRVWCGPYYNSTREGSMNIQAALGVKITGEQKVGPFPHWSLSTQIPNKRFSILQQPPSDWFVGNQISHSMEAGHTVGTVRSEIDFYYNLGALINQYSHTLSTGLGQSGGTATEYVVYAMNTNRFPRLWSANAIKIYNWWLQRSNVQMTVTVTTNGSQINTACLIKNSANTNTTIELLTPATSQFCNLEVYTNGVLAGTNLYRIVGSVIKLRVGTTVTNALFKYYPLGGSTVALAQNFDGNSAPTLPIGWTTANSGAQSPWVTQAATADSSPNSAFAPNPANIGTSDLISPTVSLAAGQALLTFRNNYDLESGVGGVGFDGGVLEIKIGAGAFTDIITAGGSFVSGGYNSTIDSSFSSPITGRLAWSASSGGYITTAVNLPAFATAQDIQLRWRCATDNGGSAAGWRIDSVTLSNRVCLCCISGTNNPVLPAQTNRTINELSTLTVTNTASDADANETLFYALQNPPVGASISGSGIITWTPAENQGPSTNTLTTIVTDSTGRTATNSFDVIVLHVNTAPVLPGQTNRAINELTTLTVTNTATDADLPADALSYSLLVAPAGASISVNGVITWPTAEIDGPGVFTITTRVVDNGTPALSATNTFTVTVNEVNTVPTLPAQSNRTINEAVALVVTNTASDGDLPGNGLSYQLLNPPSGASINGSGIVNWTPTESQGPSTNTITTVVTDNGTPNLSATNSFTVIVNEVNSAPSFIVTPTNQIIAELTLLTVTNAATDSDVPTNVLTYALTGPATATINTNTGVITWTTGEADGPSTNTFITVASDGTASVTNSFTVAVTEVNQAPVLPVQTNRTIAELSLLTVTNTATDGDLPANTLTYQLINSPAGASINSGGIITWTPTEAQGPGIYTNFTVVSDGIVSVTNSFAVTVTEVNQAPVLPVQTNRTIAELALLTVTNTASDGDLPVNALTYQLLNPPGNAVISASGIITWTPSEGEGPGSTNLVTVVSDGTVSVTNSFTVTVTEVNQAPVLPVQTNRTIAELTVLTVTNTATDADLPVNTVSYSLLVAPTGASISASGIITWSTVETNGPGVYTFTTRVVDNGSPTLSATNSFNVTVTEVNQAPVLPAQTNRTIAELTLLTVTNIAADADLPANTLTYQLISPPGNAAISPGGVITWTPLESEGPGTNTITTVVNDGFVSVTNSFSVIVTELNQAPVLPAQTNLNVAELTLLTVTNTATDADLPANTLTYQLIDPPGNAVITTNGIITWTPQESEGPGTNIITTVVSDGAVTVTNSFTITVTEVNQLPVLPVQTNRTIAELSQLLVTNSATDGDLPANVLAYSLLVAPSGATIDSSGVITWATTETDGGTTNTFTTVVNDGSLTATNTFQVIVIEVNQPPVLPPQTNRAIAELTLLTVTNTATDADLPANLLTYQLISPPSGASINASGVITWTPTEAQGPSSPTFTTIVSDGTVSVTNSFVVTVTEANQPPVLPPQINRFIAELERLVVTNSATDADLPANVLTYQLLNPPANVFINAGGVITWIPTVTQGASTNLITTIASDGSASITNSFTVTVADTLLGLATNVTLVSTGSVWSYLDNGSNQGSAWQNLGFDASSWSNGPAQLGYGDGDEQTVVSFGTNSNAKFITTYFRRMFNVVDHNFFSGLNLRLLRDDGVVIYLNGTEVFRNNLPSTAINYQTLALTSIGGTDETTFINVPLDPVSLVNGTNVIAVEIHQNAGSSTDISFDLELTGVLNLINPALASKPDASIAELATLTVTNSATDLDTPADALSYQLLNPPGNAAIDANGVITWTPGENEGPGTQLLTTLVTDGVLSATNSFVVTVNEVNSAPTFVAIPPSVAIPELTAFTVTNNATDTDLPANTLIYSLLNAPSGAVINNSGVITWTPTEVQGPGSYLITTVVSDGAISMTNSFEVVVTEVNSAPTLAPIANRTIHAGSEFALHCIGNDSNGESNRLTFSFVGSVPLGAAINSTNGLVAWTTTDADANTTNSFTVRVTDDGVPAMSDARTFTVAVVARPLIQTITVTNDVATLTWSALAGQAYRLQYTDSFSPINWTESLSDVMATGPTATTTNAIGAMPQRFYRVLVLP